MKAGGWASLAAVPALLMLAACRSEPVPPAPLDALFAPVAGGFRHVSSYDTAGGNRDRHEIAPGDSAVLLEADGPGVIRRLWITVASGDPHHLRRIALRMYWEGEEDPSVAVPLGDFFGNAWDRRHWASQVMGASSGGWFTYLPMPFARHARIVAHNESDLPIDAFYFNADVETGAALPRDPLTFHAAWSRDPRTTSSGPHRVLQARGRGRFVGMALNAESHAGDLAFLEGDETFHVDGEFRGQGTGTEDYFNAGWYFDQGPFSAPFHGLVVKDESLGRIAAYRWHIPDPVVFRDSIRVELEHGHANEAVADYATVAFWYQTEPHGPQPPLPPALDRLVTAVKLPAGVITGDSLQVRGAADSAVIEVRPRVGLNEVLLWPRGAPGAAPLMARIDRRARWQALERAAPWPGPLPAVSIDTVRTFDGPVTIEVVGPGAALAVHAVQLRPVRDFALEWSVLGPFPNPQRLGTEYSVALDAADPFRVGTEADTIEAADGRRLGWRPATGGPDGQVRLNPLFEPDDRVAAYARSWLHSPAATNAVLLLGADDAHILWVNGTEVSRRQGRNISYPDDIMIEVPLHAGWNEVLLLVADLDGGWGFHLRASHPGGLAWSRLRDPTTGEPFANESAAARPQGSVRVDTGGDR